MHDNRPIIIGIIYSKPNTDISEFQESLIDVLHDCNIDSHYCILLGDFNIDLHNTNYHVANTHISVLQCIELEQIVSSPTRVSQTCSSLIDHIYTNMDISIIREGTIIADLSDHFPMCAIFDEILITKPNAPQIKFRSYKRYQLVNFHRDLANAPWDTIYECADLNNAYSKFSSLFIAICDKHAPLVNKTKGKHVHKPWPTKAIKKSFVSIGCTLNW